MGTGLLAATHVTASPDISIGHLLMQMVVAMVVIVGGIWGFSKLAGRSRAAGRRAGRKAGGLLRQRNLEQGLTILSRQPLGKGKCLAVVQVGTQQFLVGIADSGLTPLGELHAGETPPGALAETSFTEAPLAEGGFFAQQAVPAAGSGAGAFPAIDLQALGAGALGAGPLGLGASGHGASGSGASGSGASGTVQAHQPVARSLGAWVDALREATVRR